MTILKNKLNVVLDIGKTNVKLIFLKNKKIVKEYKTKQQNSYFKNLLFNKIHVLESRQFYFEV